jgi:diamine N-acetyltransferase
MKEMATNILKGKSVSLRMAEPADIDFIHRMENDPGIWHFGSTLIPYSRYQVEQYVLNTNHDIYTEKQLRLLIVSGNETQHNIVGAIDLFEFDPLHRRAGVGILIVPEEREKGYAEEALILIIEYSFTVLQLHQLFCTISADNLPSILLFEKAGFERCGVRKEWLFRMNSWVDEVMYQLINNDV